MVRGAQCEASREFYWSRYVTALNETEMPCLLFDPLKEKLPIVASSKGLRELVGYDGQDMIGSSHQMLFEHVPRVHMSRGDSTNLTSFCRECTSPDVRHMGEVTFIQPVSRKDTSVFLCQVTFFLCSRSWFGSPYVFGIFHHVADDLKARITTKFKSDGKERSRRWFNTFHGEALLGLPRSLLGLPQEAWADPSSRWGAFSIYHSRLQDHSMLFHDGNTIVRREAALLNRGCMVFGDRPISPCASGIEFSVRIEGTVNAFRSWPLLGFTRKGPSASESLYPSVAKCLRASLMVGGDGEAFARDQDDNLELGFKRPSAEQLTQLCSCSDLPPGQRKGPGELKVGDVLTCRYTWEGNLELRWNGLCVLKFDMSRPLDDSADYFAVIDVSGSVSSVSLAADQFSSLDRLKHTEDDARSTTACGSFLDGNTE
eukprot:TRINITY_DN6095_c0_g1_i1.p1 TRINITY_DN6095_c0_g1~~TRINITY_DN6095_c0_g1_i1.p1  ORF type:complete len:428 (+),score=42.92 TRINITY_DN6095_c0_g1_i1:63-1346(+)